MFMKPVIFQCIVFRTWSHLPGFSFPSVRVPTLSSCMRMCSCGEVGVDRPVVSESSLTRSMMGNRSLHD